MLGLQKFNVFDLGPKVTTFGTNLCSLWIFLLLLLQFKEHFCFFSGRKCLWICLQVKFTDIIVCQKSLKVHSSTFWAKNTHLWFLYQNIFQFFWIHEYLWDWSSTAIINLCHWNFYPILILMLGYEIFHLLQKC